MKEEKNPFEEDLGLVGLIPDSLTAQMELNRTDILLIGTCIQGMLQTRTDIPEDHREKLQAIFERMSVGPLRELAVRVGLGGAITNVAGRSGSLN